MDSVFDFDFFVIGGGSGGLAASKAAAALGARVGLADFVEPSPAGTTWGLGGTCVNVGCIPKKLLHIAAQRGEVLREGEDFGFAKGESAPVDWSKLVQSINLYIRKLNWTYKTDLRSSMVKYHNAFATFVDAHTLTLTSKSGAVETVTAKTILIACGGRPSLGNYPGSEECCISSDDVFWKQTPPGKTLVVGASYIALECAGFLVGLGVDTTVMVRSILLRGFDQDLAGMIGKSMERRGVKFAKDIVPSRFERATDGKKVNVFTRDGGEESLFGQFDTVLMAVGRNGCANRLNLDKVGVMLKRTTGKIFVDKSDCTNIGNIFAIGDVVEGRLELTPPAIVAGKLLAGRLFGGDSAALMDYSTIATTVFTPVEYACVGVSEDDCVKEGRRNVVIYHKHFKPLDWELIPYAPADECYIKLITEDDGKVIGVHFLGPHAGEVIQGMAVAMKAGCTKAQLDATIGIHPTNAEQLVGMSVVKEKGVALEAAGGGC